MNPGGILRSWTFKDPNTSHVLPGHEQVGGMYRELGQGLGIPARQVKKDPDQHSPMNKAMDPVKLGSKLQE